MTPVKMSKKSRQMTKNLGRVEDRLMSYDKQSRANIDKARKEQEAQDQEELTFHPQITKVAQNMERGPAVWEQWYKVHSPRPE